MFKSIEKVHKCEGRISKGSKVRKSVSSRAGMNKHLFSVFNAPSFVILEFSTLP